MSEQIGKVYEFGPFLLDPDRDVLLKGGEPVPLPPKAFALLLAIVRAGGHTVTKEEILREVWPDTAVEEQNVGQNVLLVRRALGDKAGRPTYVLTVPRRGYRFVAEVREKHPDKAAPVSAAAGDGSTPTPDTAQTEPPETGPAGEARLYGAGPAGFTPALGGWRAVERASAAFGGHCCFALASCALYAVLYVIALFVEVAYEFERYGTSAAKVAPLIFLWMLGTSLVGLGAGGRLAQEGRGGGLAVSVSTYALAGLLLYVALGWLLPNAPITKARFQTYPAHGAYLKSVYYFLPLAAVFIIVPYHFVIATRREARVGGRRLTLALLTGRRLAAAPAGAVYVRGRWLGIALAAAAVAAVVATAHLIENLAPGEHTAFFTQLVQWRLAIYFALGLTCLVWYSQALEDIKRECLVGAVSGG